MRGIRKLGVAAVALAVGMLGAGKSHALVDDPYTSFTQPANALVMPFDETDGHATFFLVSNISGLSPAGDGFIAGVTTHWSYWSEDCSHLADVYVCLTLNDTVVVSPADVSAIDAGNNPIGPQIDPGVPWTAVAPAACAGESVHLALKSGNFGTVDFFTKAFARLARG